MSKWAGRLKRFGVLFGLGLLEILALVAEVLQTGQIYPNLPCKIRALYSSNVRPNYRHRWRAEYRGQVQHETCFNYQMSRSLPRYLLTTLVVFQFSGLFVDFMEFPFNVIVWSSVCKANRQVQRGRNKAIILLFIILVVPSEQRNKHFPETPGHISHYYLSIDNRSHYPLY